MRPIKLTDSDAQLTVQIARVSFHSTALAFLDFNVLVERKQAGSMASEV